MHIFIKNKYLIFKDYRIKCAVGKRGIGKKTQEGDLITPIGTYKINFILYRNDRVKKLQTSLKKIVITKNMGWCDDTNSTKYNKLIKLPFNFSCEKLYKKSNIYDIIIVLNFNMNPVKKNKGSAIFIHVAKKGFKNTEGCIALKKIDLLKIIKFIKKTTKVKII
ncbi:L,D-transpeptidase family protein [Candidatus Pelagibacter bacterium]|nr:L,D-transpeptidase family protein [Candidatus Pelagibacter bacterium]